MDMHRHACMSCKSGFDVPVISTSLVSDSMIASHIHMHAGSFWLWVCCSYYAELAGPENAAKYQTPLFLAGAASAEFFADIGLCPLEAVKVECRPLLHSPG